MERRVTMRLTVLAGVLLLIGCRDAGVAGDEPASPRAGRDSRVECALNGAAGFERICTLERSTGAEGLTLTVRAPDGSFRRLLVTDDGRGVIAADGAAPATVSVIADNRIEVAIAGDRYRLPATVQAE